METDEAFRQRVLDQIYGSQSGVPDRQLDTFIQGKCTLFPFRPSEELRNCLRNVLGARYGLMTVAMTAEEYAAQRQLLEHTRDGLRHAGYNSSADEYEEYIAELDSSWVAQGGGTPVVGMNGTLKGTAAPPANTLPPGQQGQVIKQVVRGGITYTFTGFKPEESPTLESASAPCAFCQSASKRDYPYGTRSASWRICESTRCWSAALIAKEWLETGGIQESEELRRDAVRRAVSREPKRY